MSASFVCGDSLSGIATCTSPITFGQGAAQTATGTATDIAGNTATRSTSVTVKRVCEREQDTLIDIGTWRSHASNPDAQKMRHVGDDLGDFIDPSRCSGDSPTIDRSCPRAHRRGDANDVGRAQPAAVLPLRQSGTLGAVGCSDRR